MRKNSEPTRVIAIVTVPEPRSIAVDSAMCGILAAAEGCGKTGGIEDGAEIPADHQFAEKTAYFTGFPFSSMEIHPGMAKFTFLMGKAYNNAVRNKI